MDIGVSSDDYYEIESKGSNNFSNIMWVRVKF